jgi:hypothetical protein
MLLYEQEYGEPFSPPCLDYTCSDGSGRVRSEGMWLGYCMRPGIRVPGERRMPSTVIAEPFGNKAKTTQSSFMKTLHVIDAAAAVPCSLAAPRTVTVDPQPFQTFLRGPNKPLSSSIYIDRVTSPMSTCASVLTWRIVLSQERISASWSVGFGPACAATASVVQTCPVRVDWSLVVPHPLRKTIATSTASTPFLPCIIRLERVYILSLNLVFPKPFEGY